MNRRTRLAAIGCALLVVTGWLGFHLRAMRRDPHVDAARLYAAGGLSRLVAVTVTDTFAPSPLLAPSPSRTPSPSASPSSAGILFVSIRSARADRVPSSVTPNLGAFAARSARFTQAYVSLAMPRPTWATWMTGRWPHTHGILSEAQSDPPLGDTLAARLASAGYTTRALTDGPAVRLDGLGFAAVDQVGPARDPRVLAGALVEAIRSTRRPFFVAASFDAVAPPHAFVGPRPRSTSASYRGRFKYAGPREDEAAPSLAEDRAQIRALYDDALAAVDDALGEVLAAAAAEGVVVVLTAEHGQALFEEKRGEAHGVSVIGDEAMHVPLAIGGPGISARVVDGVVRDVDVAPTVLALVGSPPLAAVDGASFAPSAAGAPLAARLAFGETDPGRGSPDPLHVPAATLDVSRLTRHRSVHDGRWKLVLAPTRSGDRRWLFDTASDPGETRDVAAAHPDVLGRLAPQLDAHRRAAQLPPRSHDVLWVLAADDVTAAHAARGTTFASVWPASERAEEELRARIAGAPPSALHPSGADEPSLLTLAGEAGMDARTFDRADDALAFVDAPHTGRRLALAATSAGLGAVPARRDRMLLVTRAPRSESPARASPALLEAEGLLPARGVVATPVRSTDLAPTLVELLGLPSHPRMRGRSLVRVVRGEEREARPVLVEAGRARTLVWNEQLFRDDGRRATFFALDGGPVAPVPDLLPELRARLAAAEQGVAVAGSDAARAPDEEGARVRLRFAGAGASRRVAGHVEVGGADGAPPRVEPVGVPREAMRVHGGRIELSFSTPPDAPVGLDLVLRRGHGDVTWALFLDDVPWPADAVFGGAAGLPAPALARGIRGGAARAAARGETLPVVDAARELGVFVVRSEVASNPR